jgi:hypothetical protein
MACKNFRMMQDLRGKIHTIGADTAAASANFFELPVSQQEIIALPRHTFSARNLVEK